MTVFRTYTIVMSEEIYSLHFSGESYYTHTLTNRLQASNLYLKHPNGKLWVKVIEQNYYKYRVAIAQPFGIFRLTVFV